MTVKLSPNLHSLMVRLEFGEVATFAGAILFQFLDGTIRAISTGEVNAPYVWFQFLDGTIRAIDISHSSQSVATFQFLDGTM